MATSDRIDFSRTAIPINNKGIVDQYRNSFRSNINKKTMSLFFLMILGVVALGLDASLHAHFFNNHVFSILDVRKAIMTTVIIAELGVGICLGKHLCNIPHETFFKDLRDRYNGINVEDGVTSIYKRLWKHYEYSALLYLMSYFEVDDKARYSGGEGKLFLARLEKDLSLPKLKDFPSELRHRDFILKMPNCPGELSYNLSNDHFVLGKKINNCVETYACLLSDGRIITKIKDLHEADVIVAYFMEDCSDYKSLESEEVPYTYEQLNQLNQLNQEIAKGIKALHDSGIIHCDIKPENILVKRDSDGNIQGVKICDFGAANRIGSETSSLQGTSAFWPPEVTEKLEEAQSNKGLKHSKTSDYWALGCMLFEKAFGKRFFKPNEFDVKKQHERLLARLTEDDDNSSIIIPKYVRGSAYDRNLKLVDETLSLADMTMTGTDEEKIRILGQIKGLFNSNPQLREAVFQSLVTV